MKFEKDPIGHAIYDFSTENEVENITVIADSFDDDIMPTAYLFRPEELMPGLEKKALELCNGYVLDVGAAAGCHSKILIDKGLKVRAIDTSKGAVEYLKSEGILADRLEFLDCEGQYDTILLLMNGVGIAGKLELLPQFLSKIKSLLNKDGMALCDSTDLSYLYQEDDGSMWVDLNGSYHGELQFKMRYKDVTTDWFSWLYIDFDLLKEHCEKAGLSCEKIMDGPSNNYLAKITHSHV